MSATAEDTRFGTSLPPGIQRRLRLQAAFDHTVRFRIDAGLAGDVEHVARPHGLGEPERLKERPHRLAGDGLHFGHRFP